MTPPLRCPRCWCSAWRAGNATCGQPPGGKRQAWRGKRWDIGSVACCRGWDWWSLLWGICFTENNKYLSDRKIPNSWVMWNIGTFTLDPISLNGGRASKDQVTLVVVNCLVLRSYLLHIMIHTEVGLKGFQTKSRPSSWLYPGRNSLGCISWSKLYRRLW